MKLPLSLMATAICSAIAADIKPSADLRAFYFDRGFDGTAPRTRSLNLGGVVKASADVGATKVTMGYYGSYQVTGMFTNEEAKGTSLVQPNGKDIGFLGEANVEYQGLKIGRQRLSTPLMNDHDLRMLPSVYQGVTYTTDIGSWKTQVGYIDSYSGFASKNDGFKDIGSGLIYGYLSGNDLNAQIVKANDDVSMPIEWYSYADYKIPLDDYYVQAQVGHNTYKVGDNSYMYGVKAGTKFHEIDVTILWNEIEGNNWKAVESGAMFSDWQQGYGQYNPSHAYGLTIGSLTSGIDWKLGAVKVVGNLADDYTEWQADAIKQFDANNKLRFRYSLKDQTERSGRADRDDLRVIYYWSF